MMLSRAWSECNEKEGGKVVKGKMECRRDPIAEIYSFRSGTWDAHERGRKKIGTKYTGKFAAIVLSIIFFANVQGERTKTQRVEVRPDMNFKEKSQRCQRSFSCLIGGCALQIWNFVVLGESNMGRSNKNMEKKIVAIVGSLPEILTQADALVLAMYLMSSEPILAVFWT